MSLLLAAAGLACLPVQGVRITASDLAAATPVFSQLPAEPDFGFAPAPGAVRVFSAAELNARLIRNGLEGVLTDSVCFARPMRTANEEELRAAMLAVLPPDSEVTFAAPIAISVPSGTLVFPTEGLRNGLWRGYVEYEPRKRFALTVRVEVLAPFTRVIATEAIRAGERITESKLRVERGEGEPSAHDEIAQLEDVLDRVAKRLIRPGSAVVRSALGAARVVARGDAVTVHVVSGAAVLRFEGIAEAPAGAGDLAPVRNPETGKVVHVRLDGQGAATLLLTHKEN